MHDPLNILRKEIIDEYDSVFNSVISHDISAVAEAINQKIFMLLEDAIYENAALLIKNSIYSPDNRHNRIYFENNYYIIRCQEVLDDPQTIAVAIIKLYGADRKLNPTNLKEVKITGIGKYKRLSLNYPEKFDIKYDLVLAILKTIFETSYGWLFQKIKGTIYDNHMFTDTLYSRIKMSLPNQEEIYNSIWFVVMNKEKLMLLLDKENIIDALKKLDATAIHPEVGPYKLLDEFINMRLPFEKAFALQALKAGECFDGIIDKGKYANELPLLASSQIKIFSAKVSVFPMLTDWKSHLYVSFPTEYKGIVLPILELNKERLISEFKDLDSRIKKMIKTMKMHNLEVEKVAEFLGTFAASYTKTFLK